MAWIYDDLFYSLMTCKCKTNLEIHEEGGTPEWEIT